MIGFLNAVLDQVTDKQMAKVLIVTHDMIGAWFSLQMEAEGHNVDIWLHKNYEDYRYVLSGIVKTPLKAKPNFKNYDLVIFDVTDQPHIAEEVMALGVPCIGDGDLNTEMENDRLLGIQIMEQCDINVPFYETFDDLSEAKKFIRKTNKRYVFKPDDFEGQDKASTYVSKSAEDMLKFIDKLSASTKGVKFILQEVVEGTEISTEAWFNGNEFFLISGTLEEKKFMDHGIGPNTGCAGNLEIIYDQVNPPALFKEGLLKMKDFLNQYNFKGYIDLNTIVNDSKIFGLEWTPRFGYDCTSTLFSCINNVTEFIGVIASGGTPNIDLNNNFAAGVRLSIPPYPTEIKGHHPSEVPIEGIEHDDIIKECFLYDCCLDRRDELCTAGVSGFIGVPISSGGSLQESWARVNAKVKKIHIPDMQYRTDLESKTKERYEIVSRMGWLR